MGEASNGGTAALRRAHARRLFGAEVRLGVTLAILVVCLPDVSPARACSPWAERLMTWDARADAAVVAIWTGRDRAPQPIRSSRETRSDPSSGERSKFKPPPEQYELRRISTGSVLANLDCQVGAGGAGSRKVGAPSCDWRTAFAKELRGAPDGASRGRPFPSGMVRVRSTRSPQGGRHFALEAMRRGSWRRVLWLGASAQGNPERRFYRVAGAEQVEGDVIVTVEYQAAKGNCPYTRVQMLSIPEQDFANPSLPDRHPRLLARVREDTPFGYWRTVAELGPLPAGRLLDAMETAEVAGEFSLAAQWWKASITGLEPDNVATLKAKLVANPGLGMTRAALESARFEP